jgi:methylglutaconyl-CoA hydratase
MAGDGAVLSEIGADGTGWLSLNRPERHNAFDESLIAELTHALQVLAADQHVRAVAIAATGNSFSAGGDLRWMQRMAESSFEDNLADAGRLALLLETLDRLPKPTLALVQGAAYGGGVGLIAACDVAIAADSALFAFTEVKLGLVPAVISPYVIAAIGQRAARRYFLTAERFDAAEALRLGLVHKLVPEWDLRPAAAGLLATLAGNSIAAMAAAKRLIRAVAGRPIDELLTQETAREIAAIRASGDAQRRISAFLNRQME